MFAGLAALALAGSPLALMEPTPDVFVGRGSGGSGPIHRRGKFKPNARRQKGRKTLPKRVKS